MKKKHKTKNGLCLGHLVTNPDSSVGGTSGGLGQYRDRGTRQDRMT